ncbi:type IV pilus secretin PilQ [Conservatibacter flavescens]|uniref:Type IV pilus secretin PilQ n=1 Tax=Conservatibacter flavescens TaxID=28161 RepID=A0A2M8S0U7_9PAST|nr:type IV pilus secretin PilQ [Conservatibacter flavescens]PJG84734.1 type IV pilus secretin PilQ [Conservatibacter flavescens]
MSSRLFSRLKCGLFFLIFSCTVTAENQVFSIRLKQAPLVPVLQQLALAHRTNLIIDDELSGTVSLQLDNTDFDHLLRAMARLKKFDLWQENNVYYLSPLSQEAKFASPMDNHASHATIMPDFSIPASTPTINEPSLITTSIKLHFAKASEVMKSLTTGNGSLLSANGSIAFDDRSNLLLIQDNKHSIQNIKKLIAEMDKPIEQIAIEARIVTISDDSLKELGVRWGIFNPTDTAHKVTGSLAANQFQNLTEQLNVNFATSNSPAGSVAVQIAKINGRLLDLELTALERENNVKIIASPRLLTTNKKSASIKQGTEIPYVITNTTRDTQSIEFREAVLGLEVTPHISRDNSILLDLVVSQNSPGNNIISGVGEMTTIDKQEINTQVFARDGETIVLGGVFHDTLIKGVDKVPLLGDIPVVKRLFSKETEKYQKRELVIFVTPHILKRGQTLTQLQQEKNNKKTKK